MRRYLQGFVDSAVYYPSLGISIIEGWGINPGTKEPVEIELNVPYEFHPVIRNDINELFNIPFKTLYGFLITMPGDYRKTKVILTFKSGPIVERERLIENNTIKSKLYNWYKRTRIDLENLGYLQRPLINEKKQVPRNMPEDELKEWMDNEEIARFSPKTDYPVKMTYIIKGDDEGLRQTIGSIEETDPDAEILFATTKDIGQEKFRKEKFDTHKYPVFKVEPGAGETEEEALFKALEEALKNATGDYITFVETKDKLSPHFYNEIATALKENPEADFIYADSDLLDEDYRRYDINFKPDFDPVLLRHKNYILSPVVLKRELFDKIGGLRKDYMGLKDYDLILRAVKEANQIVHIPKSLYHWRKTQGKIINSLLRNSELGAKILDDVLGSYPLKNKLSELEYAFTQEYEGEWPSVTIITGVCEGFSDKKAQETVWQVLDSVVYPDFNIIAVNVSPFTEDERVKFIEIPEVKDLTQLYNEAAKVATGDYLMFIRPGFEAVDMDWLKEMVSLAQTGGVGIVGPKVFNIFYTLDSCGITVDEEKRYDLARGRAVRASWTEDYLVPKEVFAVREEALLIKRSLFEELGGFNTDLEIQNQSIDLSIRARQKGYQTVCAKNTPVQIDGFKNLDGMSIKEIADIYPKEALVDTTMNENLRVSGSARPYLREKI